ncbi:KEOPS complex subunit Pcc1 [Halolamina litorea]|uniref:KEOPS complex subunit Pcc1 n=1 Tax=Halolamina litorea TaxID=1515593 RepID=A0ABD6BQN1_9EURY|nr:KEOPS complex subunit Pcc1 [Halolamina litorea]
MSEACEEQRHEATLSTTHDDPGVVAAALAPDNTDAMTTAVDGDAVRTTIAREGAGGLAASVDDYLVNLTVADAVSETARDTDNS